MPQGRPPRPPERSVPGAAAAAGAAPDAASLVVRLGAHPARALGLAAGEVEEDALDRWLLGAALRAALRDEARAARAEEALGAAGLTAPAALAEAPTAEVAAALEAAAAGRAEALAARLVRLARGRRERAPAGLAALAAEAEGLDDLGARLAGLAPGFGAAAAAEFLRPLREAWPSAAELPLSPAAHAAAACLGWIGEGEDAESAPGTLARRLRGEPGAPPLSDLEAALARLGARACRRARPSRCPLGTACPRRGRVAGPGPSP